MHPPITTTSQTPSATITQQQRTVPETMPRFFTTQYTTPLLFRHFDPHTPSSAAGAWVLILVTGLLYRALAFESEHHRSGSSDETPKYTSNAVVATVECVKQEGGVFLMAFVRAAVGYGLMLVV
jgi:hypothetical protein